MRDNNAKDQSHRATVRRYFDLARAGQIESAFFGLIDLDKTALPILEQEFRMEQDPSIRALAIKVVWNARSPASVRFLVEALSDPHPQVWNEALDGLVALASPESSRAVECALVSETEPKRRVLLREAYQQIQKNL
jgi:HEAT repeat protein